MLAGRSILMQLSQGAVSGPPQLSYFSGRINNLERHPHFRLLWCTEQLWDVPLLLAMQVRRHGVQAPAVAAKACKARLTLLSLRAAASASGTTPSWEIRMLYDGDCPLCMKEVDFLKGRDAGKGKIDFVDIASPNYDPADNQGITFEQAMESIHAITADGRVVTGIEVFRRLYEAIGLGWVYAITANPTVERLGNTVYGVWAKYRMQITGREALSVILERRRQQREAGQIAGSMCSDENAACEIPLPTSNCRTTEQGDEMCDLPVTTSSKAQSTV